MNQAPSQAPIGFSSHSLYSEKEKTYALAIYAESGSLAYASRLTAIPASTIARWVEKPEGEAQVLALRNIIRTEAAWDYVQMIVLGNALILKTLREGEEHLTRDGTVRKVMPKLKDLVYMVGNAQEKHVLLTAADAAKHDADKGLRDMAQALIKELGNQGLEVTTKARPSLGDASPYLG